MPIVEKNIPYGYIYKTTNLVNGNIYIGQTIRQNKQLEYYLGSGIKIKQAIKKYGRKNFVKEIIAECNNQNELDFLEKKYILDLKPKYNIENGSRGGVGRLTEETKEKHRLASIGNKSNLGKKFSKEHREKIAAGRTGKKVSDCVKKSISEKNSIKILCIETNIIYKSALEAKKITGIDNSSISRVCKNKQKVAGGYHWKYAEVINND